MLTRMARCMSDLGRSNFAIDWDTMLPNWRESKGKWQRRSRAGAWSIYQEQWTSWLRSRYVESRAEEQSPPAQELTYIVAPQACSNSTTPTCPFSIAQERAVLLDPSAFALISTSPVSSNSSTTATCPARAAHISGVHLAGL